MAYVLIADDDDNCRSLLSMQIRALGHEVGAAKDGGEAVAAATERHADLVILDVCMPVHDGFATAAKLRAMDGYAETPIMALTSLDDTFGIHEARHAGFTDLIFKPWQVKVLEGRIKSLLADHAS